MSVIVRLKRRFPFSRPEDITEAYMRGFEEGMRIAGKDDIVEPEPDGDEWDEEDWDGQMVGPW